MLDIELLLLWVADRKYKTFDRPNLELTDDTAWKVI